MEEKILLHIKSLKNGNLCFLTWGFGRFVLTACRTEWLGDRQEGYGSTLLDLRTLEAFRSSSDAYSSQEPASQSYHHPVRIK